MLNNSAKMKTINFTNSQRVFILIIIVFALFNIFEPTFLSTANIINILMSISMEGIMLIGMTFLIIMGEIDLSIGAVMSVSCACVILFQDYGIAAGIIAGLAVGFLIGLLNGLIVVKLHVASMPATLGVMVLVNSLVYVLTQSTSIWGKNEQFALISDASFQTIPIFVFFFIALVIIFNLILKKTTFGRNVYAVGGNIRAAEYAGINVDKVRITSFILTGLLAGLAGVLLVTRYNVASGLIGGDTALKVITAVLLGGVSLTGGEGSVVKAFFGLLLVGSLDIGMQLLKFPTSVQPIVVGGLLIGILALEASQSFKEKFK